MVSCTFCYQSTSGLVHHAFSSVNSWIFTMKFQVVMISKIGDIGDSLPWVGLPSGKRLQFANRKIWKWTIEIASFPMHSMVIFHSKLWTLTYQRVPHVHPCIDGISTSWGIPNWKKHGEIREIPSGSPRFHASVALKPCGKKTALKASNHRGPKERAECLLAEKISGFSRNDLRLLGSGMGLYSRKKS